MDYHSQDLGQLWSGKMYREGYGQGVHFNEGNLPFKISEIASSAASVLEIGSSFGQCYRFLLSQGVDLRDRYTGTDVSQEGVSLCQELYPTSTWIQGNFLEFEPGRTFDYVIERNAIHHMPSPLRCIEKAVNLCNHSVMMYMRVRTQNETLSDISKGYFVSRTEDGLEKGRYFYNLVNIYEMVDTIVDLDNVQEIHLGLSPHDTAPTLESAFVPNDVIDPSEELYYCKCLVIKGNTPSLRISVRQEHKKPFVLDGLKRPSGIYRYFSVRRKLLKRNSVSVEINVD